MKFKFNPKLPPWRPAAALALAVLVAGVLWVRHAGREPLAWYPPCPLHATTGVLCPGCGSARTLHDLAHGDLKSAAGHNILVVAVAPLLAVWAALALWRGLAQNRPPPAPPLRAAKITLIVVVVFTIARNLPWWPFALLAP
ncbi:MAG: DUF2752 domain-containing protein [Opitutaceae bacterium]|nr:DUF2752 domain-containing protein [Opitutaceae bacterium]